MRSLVLPALALVVALSGCSALPPQSDQGAQDPGNPAETSTPTPTPAPTMAKSIAYADLANAPVPSLCDFAPGTLQNGKYAGDLAAAAPPDANPQYATRPRMRGRSPRSRLSTAIGAEFPGRRASSATTTSSAWSPR